jgi:hypothetical protein
MYFVTFVTLLAAGVLGAANLIIAKKPDAQRLIDKMTPFQGWIGIGLFGWGSWDLIWWLLNLGWFKWAPVWFIIAFLTILVEIVLGFLLGFGLLTKFILSKNEQALAKGQQIRAKLAKFQGPLGLAAIVLAHVFLILRFVRI